MIKPIVGVIGNSYAIEDDYIVQASGDINTFAIAKAVDAIPVIIPSLPHVINPKEIAHRFDGFVFTGGRPNVHPEEYGEPETEAHGIFDRDRDAVALPLIKECVAQGVPILGICRGFQEFNVAFGGTLYPEIRELPGRMNHRMPPDGTIEEKFAHRHDVVFDKGSVFEELFSSNKITTNSLHGQGIKTAGERIIIEGYATDGTPEAIRIKDAENFALAVQWHPEWKGHEDPVSRKLFTAFSTALYGTRK